MCVPRMVAALNSRGILNSIDCEYPGNDAYDRKIDYCFLIVSDVAYM